MDGRIFLQRGDITRVAADVIVNASNAYMLPGGGVSGAIHAAADQSVERESREIVERRGPLDPGEAAATTAGELPARHIVHALGPVWHGGHSGEAEALASAYRESIRVADELGAASIAFPSISTGIFGYPADRAAPVALRAVRDALARATHMREARFVLFDEETYQAYERALERVQTEAG